MSGNSYKIIPKEAFKKIDELTTYMGEFLRMHEKFKSLDIDLDKCINVEQLELQINKKISSIIYDTKQRTTNEA